MANVGEIKAGVRTAIDEINSAAAVCPPDPERAGKVFTARDELLKGLRNALVAGHAEVQSQDRFPQQKEMAEKIGGRLLQLFGESPEDSAARGAIAAVQDVVRSDEHAAAALEVANTRMEEILGHVAAIDTLLSQYGMELIGRNTTAVEAQDYLNEAKGHLATYDANH